MTSENHCKGPRWPGSRAPAPAEPCASATRSHQQRAGPHLFQLAAIAPFVTRWQHTPTNPHVPVYEKKKASQKQGKKATWTAFVYQLDDNLILTNDRNSYLLRISVNSYLLRIHANQASGTSKIHRLREQAVGCYVASGLMPLDGVS